MPRACGSRGRTRIPSANRVPVTEYPNRGHGIVVSSFGVRLTVGCVGTNSTEDDPRTFRD